MDWIHDPTWLKVARAQGSVSIPRRNIASYYETVIYKLISYDDGNDSTRSTSAHPFRKWSRRTPKPTLAATASRC
jgi:hypothetical protein